MGTTSWARVVLAAVAALAVGAAAALLRWDTAVGVVLAVLAATTWWGLATRRELRDLGASAAGGMPDHTITPMQAARMDNAGTAGELGFGGGGDAGGGGGG